jgi:small subunit ribosomal protein S19
MAKEFTYRGLSWEEVLKLKPTELENILDSRARRTLQRAKGLDKRIVKAIAENKSGKEVFKPVKTHKREILITPDMVGLKMAVYTGKEFVTLGITKEMIGFYLGEFVETRKRPKHSKAGIGATKSSKHVGKK